MVAFFDSSQQFYLFKPDLQIPINTLITTHKSNFRISNANTLNKVDEKEDLFLGGTFYRFEQKYNGIKVEGSMLNILYDANSNPLNSNGQTFENINIPNINPNISKTQAINTAISFVPADKYYWQDSTLETEIKEEKHDSLST